MDRKIILVAAIMGMTAIIFGAFGAHGLKELLTEQKLATFETGVKYQMYHALFLLCLGNMTGISEKAKKNILYLVSIGVLFFSVSIYLLSTGELIGIDFKKLGIVTPIGGLLLIAAWIILFVKFLNKKG
ncbi:MAG TPA: DUF423 domain-containing protein [Flavobacterium sp.]|jgi:uncharacterized membrane protein YgdD (TMEM256/DUF423 family)|nr:DUF423 domain-containing protein [Flavobacterium sp.]